MNRVEQDFNPEGITYVVACTRDRRVIRDALAQADSDELSAIESFDDDGRLRIDASEMPLAIQAVGLYVNGLGIERSNNNTRKRAERLIGAMVVASAQDYNRLFVLDQ